MARCSQLTDVGFTTLARNCHELEKMDLEECVQITDSTLIQLSIHCPRLQVLSLSHCELITDDGIRHLGNGACAHDQLEVIELDNCPLITDASLEHLKSCHSLERIELYDCQQITRAGIKRLRTHLPNIKVHAYFAPVTPPPSVGGSRQRFCRCCIILWQWRWSTLVNWVFNDTSRVTVDLHWKQPQCSGQRLQSEGGVQIPRATHNTHTHSHPDPVCLCDQGTEFVLALSCGLVKLNHSCWMCPEENHKQGRWKGAFQQTQFYCYCGFFILLRGFFGNFGTATAVLQGQGKHRKTIHVVSGTRGKISLHPINGSHPLWDD